MFCKKSIFLCAGMLSLSVLNAGNLLSNPDGEITVSPQNSALKSYRKLKNVSQIPTGWGCFSLTDFGVSTEHKVSGKQSVYAGHKANAKVNTAKPRFSYLLIGETDGYNGSHAIQVTPGKKYVWSVWVRGDAGACEVRMLGWPENKASYVKYRKLGRPCGLIWLLPKWQLLAGEYTVPAGINRIAIGLRVPEIKPGQRIYADQATFEEAPSVVEVPTPGKIRVAVYDPGDGNKYGQKRICETLKRKGMDAELTDTLADSVLNKYDVLILTTCRNVSKKDRGDLDLGTASVDWVGAVLRFADKGGGVILGHDCVGERGVWEIPLFPRICCGNGIQKSSDLHTVNLKHPVTKGLPAQFKQTYFDHIKLNCGPRGVALVKDDSGNITVAAGELKRGRIVGIGFPLCLAPRDYPVEANAAEQLLLVNAVKWAGSAKRFKVAPILTDASLRADYNLRSSRNAGGLLQQEKKAMAEIVKYPVPKFGRKLMWTMSYRMYTPALVEKAVMNAKNLGFNVIVFQANDGHDLFYKSAMYPDCTFRRGNRFLDVLAEAKKYTAKHGIKLGVFVTTVHGSRNNSHCGLIPEISSLDREKLKHGELTMEQIRKRRNWACATHPKNQERCLKIYREIMEKYQPETICFDYVRYSTGYDDPCRCDYCEKKRGSMSPKEFAHRELMDFYTRAIKVCKSVDPKVITACYTMSSGSEWVFRYPFDEHYKYVSRENETPLSDVYVQSMKWGKLMKKYNPNGIFVPMIANYTFKTGERMYLECKAVSKALDELKQKARPVIYYDYGLIAVCDQSPKAGTLIEDTASGLRKGMTEKE